MYVGLRVAKNAGKFYPIQHTAAHLVRSIGFSSITIA